MRRSYAACALWLTALFLHRVEMSGAVPADEFAPAYIGYMLITPLRVLALVLFGSQVFLNKTSGKSGQKHSSTWSGLADCMVVCGVFSEYIALVGVLIHIVVSVNSSPEDSRWPSFSLRSTGRNIWSAWLPFLCITWLLGVGELFFFTGRFFDQAIIDDEVYNPYSLSLVGFATLSALKGLLILLRIVLLGSFLLFVLRKIAPRRAVVFDLVMGLVLWSALFHLFWQTMRDELMGLEKMYAPAGSILALFAALIGLGALLLSPMLSRMRSNAASRIDGGFTDYLLAPFKNGGGRSEFWRTVCLMAGLVGFRFLLYPTVEDYRTKLFDTFAQMAILTGALLLIPLGRLFSARMLTMIAVLLTCFGISSAASSMQRPDVRLVAFEYSRFCALGASAPWASWFESRSVVGLSQPAPEDPFPVQGPNRLQGLLPSRPPIFLIIWDAARPDHLSAYGYERETTPHLAALAQDGVIFTQARSTATATTLGIRNMMTGCYSTRFMLSKEHRPFFVKDLAAAGYHDHFVTVTGNDYNGVSAEAFKRSWKPGKDVRFHVRNYSNTDELKPDKPKTEDLVEFIRSAAKSRNNPSLEGYFHYVHLTGTHSPWLGKDEVRHFGDSAIDRYDGEVAKVDSLLGKLVAELKQQSLYEDAIIIVTADHGTGLGEHGRLGGFLPYEEQVRIPLVIKGPFSGRGKSNRFVGNIDIAPTILELIGAPTSTMDGFSFADVLVEADRPLPKRAFVTFCAFRDGYAVYDPEGRYKLHHYRANGYEALFDLANDRKEKVNLVLEEPEKTRDLRSHLDHFLWRGRDRYGNPYHYRAWDIEAERKRRN